MKTFFLTLAVLLISTFCFAQNPTVLSNKNLNYIRIIEESPKKIVIEVSTNEIQIEDVKIANDVFSKVLLPDESQILEKGNPDLPKITRSIIVPQNCQLNVKVLSTTFYDKTLKVIPSKGNLPRSVDPKQIPYSFSDVYAEDNNYPKNIVSTNDPFVFRNTIGSVFEVFPVTYNPIKQKLRVYTNIIFEITFSPLNSIQQNSIVQKYNKAFEPIYEDLFINYANHRSGLTLQEDGEIGKMLIICDDSFLSQMQSFVAHKNSRGMPTTIVGRSITGSTAAQIKAYITIQYQADPSLTYVLLVGDHQQLPSTIMTLEPGTTGSVDPFFGMIIGNDNAPEVIIGRFSANSISDVNTMVQRVLNYETTPNQNWHSSGVGIASSKGPGDDGELDYEHLRNIRTLLLSSNYTTIQELYDGNQGGSDTIGNPTQSMVSNIVNSGVSIINYTGHGSSTNWATSLFNISDVNSLTNDKLPFIFSTACQVGNFTNGTCFAETWLRAKHPNNNTPTGAIAFYGSSISQQWNPPMEAQDRFNYYLSQNTSPSIGVLCLKAGMDMMAKYGAKTTDYGAKTYLTWHIFGDPSLQIAPHQVCNVPTSIQLNICDEKIKAEWNNVPNATGYIVRYKFNGGNWIELPSQVSNFIELPIQFYNTSYFIQIKTICNVGTSCFSNSYSLLTPSSSGFCPSNYSSNNYVTSNMIQAYNAGGSCSVGYQLRYRPNKASQPLWSFLPQQSSNTFNIPGLMGDEAYKIEIANICNNGTSTWVPTSSPATTSLESTSFAPTGLTVSLISTNSVALTWLSNSKVNWSNGYFVEYKKNNDINWVSTTGTSSTSWSLYGLTSNTIYQVRVKVPRSGGTDYTEPVNFITTANQSCGQLGGITISSITSTSAQVNWTNIPSYYGYYVAFKQENGNWDLAGVPGSNFQTITGLQPNKKYYVAVKAYCSNGFSNWSFSSFTTPATKSGLVENEFDQSSQTTSSEFVVSIFPNPNDGEFTMSCVTKIEGTYKLRISNANGSEVKQESLQFKEGRNNLDFHLNYLPSGTYFISIEGNGFYKTEKIVIK